MIGAQPLLAVVWGKGLSRGVNGEPPASPSATMIFWPHSASGLGRFCISARQRLAGKV